MNSNDKFLFKTIIVHQLEELSNSNLDWYEKLDIITKKIKETSTSFGYNYSNEALEDIVRTNMAQNVFDEKIIESEGYIPWLDNKKNDIEWIHRDAYHQYLLKKKNWDSKTVFDVDKYSDIILDHMADPSLSNFVKKGLVIGDVQSGKTANYTDVINKSIDAGYKFIIVLAGVHNDLRFQTQSRLDKEVLGYNTEIFAPGSNTKNRVGIGEMDVRVIEVEALTKASKSGDLKSKQHCGLLLKDDRSPVIAVVKKNTTVLEKLLEIIDYTIQIYDGDKLDVPTLIIDDEVDQASVNTKKPEYDPTRINGCIRKAINKIKRVSYVGYTATPYANILINYDPNEKDNNKEFGEDLFPKDFIVVLPSSSAYCGVKEFFGDKENTSFELIDIIEDEDVLVDEVQTKDNLIRFKAQSEIIKINNSIKKAIKDFIVASAVHRAREGKCHNGMMIHIAAYRKPTTSLKDLVEDYVNELTEAYRYDIKSREIYKSIWEDRFKNISIKRGFNDSWDDIEKELPKVFEILKVKLLNGDSNDVIDYTFSDESEIIAVGGNKLSRGITIEGLMISYYLRTPNAYDTAMQMGRWFGYKKKYLDLCRIYTKPQMVADFVHIFDSNNELREDINLMNSKELTPSTFGLKIKLHPTMKPTSSCKMRSGKKMKVSFGDERQETIHFDYDKKDYNLSLTNDFIEKLKTQYKISIEDNSPVIRNVDSSYIIDYLTKYYYPKYLDFDTTEQWISYIKELNKDNELTNWTVVVSSLDKTNDDIVDIAGYKITKAKRKHFPNIPNYTRVISNPRDFRYFFEPETKYRIKYASGYKKGDIELQKAFNIKNGLLSIYPVDITDENKNLVEKDVIGLALWFPKTDNSKCSDYIVDSVYLKPENNIYDEEEEDES